jgi:8-oxo-dGTP pyrophosphatase MutT (NUDIX family)
MQDVSGARSADAQHDRLVGFEAGTGAGDHVLVLARHDGGVILVRNRARDRWELPGGMLEPADNPAQRALAELREEAGQVGSGARRCGVAIVEDSSGPSAVGWCSSAT